MSQTVADFVKQIFPIPDETVSEDNARNPYLGYGSDEWKRRIAKRLSQNIRLRQLVEPAERWIEAQRKRQTA